MLPPKPQSIDPKTLWKMTWRYIEEYENFLRKYGVEPPKDLYIMKEEQPTCNFCENAENRLSMAQRGEIDDYSKLQPEKETPSPANTIQTGLNSNDLPMGIQGRINPIQTVLTCDESVLGVEVSNNDEFPASTAQRGEKPGNQKT